MFFFLISYGDLGDGLRHCLNHIKNFTNANNECNIWSTKNKHGMYVALRPKTLSLTATCGTRWRRETQGLQSVTSLVQVD